jgi:hypothetical protein
MKKEMRLLLIVAACLIPGVLSAQWVPNAVAVCTAPNIQSYPSIISDGSGGAIITWWDYRNGVDTNIYAQRINAAGYVKWLPNGVPACSIAGAQKKPSMISDGAGGAIIAWDDYRSGSANPNIYVQRVDSLGAVRWQLNGVPVCTLAAEQGLNQVAPDGAGGAIIVWADWRGGSSNGDIYAQRVDSTGAVRWSANGIPVCDTLQDQSWPTIVSDGAGGAIIAWEDYRIAPNYNMFAQRVDSTGSMMWINHGVRLSSAAVAQHRSRSVADGFGGAIVVWDDYRTTSYNIYGQHVNASGINQWPLSGLGICTATARQTDPCIVASGAGGAIIAWPDWRNGSTPDVYAQRVASGGTIQWLNNGIPACTTTSSQSDPRLCADEMSGAIGTWADYRSGARVYFQHLDSNGTFLLPINGIPICGALNNQINPCITEDGSNEAIIAWQDFRSGTNYDIYAQWTGFIVGTEESGASKPKTPLVTIQPNPFTDRTTICLESATNFGGTKSMGLRIYDISGNLVKVLLPTAYSLLPTAVWSGTDQSGKKVPAGVYFARITANQGVISEKIIKTR